MDPSMLSDKESPSKSYSQPRKITLKKNEYGFGFTLRHFIVYPPASLGSGSVDSLISCENEESPNQLNEWKFDEQRKPMDTIFIREVKEGSPAHREGLVKGDRIIAINNQPLIGKTYSDIIRLILESGIIIQLLVVPKEDDILQLYFASSAYEPVNRECKADCSDESSPCHQPRKYLVKKSKSKDSNLQSPQKGNFCQEQKSDVLDYTEDWKRTKSPLYATTTKPLQKDPLTSLCQDSQSLTESDDSLNQYLVKESIDCNSNQKSAPQSNWEELYQTDFNSEKFKNGFDHNPKLNETIYDDSSLTSATPGDLSLEQSFEDTNADNRTNNSSYGIVGTDYLNVDENDENGLLINLVAQRCHQFESGTLLKESLDKIKMFRSELSSMSDTNQAHIVSDNAAHFEMLSTKNKPLSSYQVANCNGDNDAENQTVKALLEEEIPSSNDASFVGSVCSENVTPDSQYQETEICSYDTSQPSSIELPSKPEQSVVVTYRKKTETGPEEECHLTRRISYLRATGENQIYLDSDSKRHHSKRKHGNYREKPFIEDKASVSFEDKDDFDCDFIPDISNSVYGWLICKLVHLEGKRASDRSWRHVWAVLREDTLYFLKERREPSEKSITSDEHVFNVSKSTSEIASDYLKRKNVLRLRLTNGTEYLLQAESQASMLRWLEALQNLQSEPPNQVFDSTVIDKATAYEQRLMSSKTSAIANHLRYPMKKLVLWYRSPTEQVRRSFHGDELSLPKTSHLWCDRVVHSWKKAHNSLSHDTPKLASIGVPIENAPTGSHKHIPLLVELCIHVIESRGLEMVGVYRIPGNSASVSILSDIVNQGLDYMALQDPRWNDVNVISSLLKSFFRKLPDPLLTSSLYPKFIAASRTEDSKKRLTAIKNVLLSLPAHHYDTLKFLMHHLKNVVNHSHINKMEARNLAIVFGPTLVRRADNNMAAMVTDMSHQCQLIETMINHDCWLFDAMDSQQPFNIQSKKVFQPSTDMESSSSMDDNFLALSVMQKESFKNDYQTLPAQPLRAKVRNRRIAHKSKRVGIIEQDLDKDPNDIFLSSKESESLNIQTSKSQRSLHSSGSTSDPFYPSSEIVSDSVDNASEPWSNAPLCIDVPCDDYSGDSEKVALGRRSDERTLHTYKELNTHAQQKVKKFELETKSLLTRKANKPTNFAKTGHFEWDTIEKEWEKAKLELEEDDFLDHLADDPLFLKFLFNQPNVEACASSQEPSLVSEPNEAAESKNSKSYGLFQPFYKNECFKPAYYLPVNSGIRKSASTSTFETESRLAMSYASEKQSDDARNSSSPRKDCTKTHFHATNPLKSTQSGLSEQFGKPVTCFAPTVASLKLDEPQFVFKVGSQDSVVPSSLHKLDCTNRLPKKLSPVDMSS